MRPTQRPNYYRALLRRDLNVPLYHQLFLSLRDRLLGGEWQVGRAFLSDGEIENTYEVSRITVRKAMDRLVDENFLVRYRGKGTFVARAASRQVDFRDAWSPLFGDLDDHRVKVLSVDRVPVSRQTAEQLRVPEDHVVAVLNLLHLTGHEPVGAEGIFVDDFKFHGVFDGVEMQAGAIDEHLAKFGNVPVKFDQSVSAVIVSVERAELLQIEPAQPGLFVMRVGYDAEGRPLQLRRLHCRADRFILRQRFSAEESRTCQK